MGIILILSLISFGAVVNDIFIEPKEGDIEALDFDNAVLNFFKEHRSPAINQSMIDITALGSLSVITLLTTVLVILHISQKDWIGILYIGLIMLGSSFIPGILKNIFMRERPAEMERLATVATHSFPSGHSFSATVAYFAMAYLVSREVKSLKLEVLYYVLATVVVALVGFSRMYLGVHYPSDIAAGISLGIAWFSIVSIPFVYASKRKIDSESF